MEQSLLDTALDARSTGGFRFCKIMFRRITRKEIIIVVLIAIVIFYMLYVLVNMRQIPPTPVVAKRPEILLFIGVVNAPVRRDRRQAIRQTWATKCTLASECVYKFITDEKYENDERLNGRTLDQENHLHNDLVFSPIPPGLNARRYLWWIEWVFKHFRSKYLLRLDDDYFICVEKIILELSFYRPKKRFLWGWLHCIKGIVRLDQSFLLISQDIGDYVLARNRMGSLLCHPMIDQAFTVWVQNYPGLQTFGDNKRLYHHDYDIGVNGSNIKSVCKQGIGYHKSYPSEMKILWNIASREVDNSTFVPPVVYPCSYPHELSFADFENPWRFKPKPCADNPVWGDSYFKGRENAK